MIKKQLLVFNLIFLFALNLKAQRCENYCEPSKKNFLFKNRFYLIDSSTIKTNGIYLYRYLSESDTTKMISRFYRFYKDGKVFISGDYCSSPSLNDLKDTTFGCKSYFRIINEKIEIEFFGGRNVGYAIEKGKIIDANNIIFFFYKPRSFFASAQKYPHPREMNFISFE